MLPGGPHGDLHPLALDLPGVDRCGGVIGLCRHPQETSLKFHALKSVKRERQDGEGHRHGRNGDQDGLLQCGAFFHKYLPYFSDRFIQLVFCLGVFSLKICPLFAAPQLDDAVT